MFGAPSDTFMEFEQARRIAGCRDGLFAEVSVAGEVDFYAAREIEAALYRSFDESEFFEMNHEAGAL
jgi:hypothetical protein